MNQQPKTKPKPNWRIIFIIIGIVLVIILLILGYRVSKVSFNLGPVSVDVEKPATSGLILLAGVWSGEFKAADAGPWDILLTVNGNCRLNEVCGTVQYDQSSCTASVIFTSIENNRYNFEAKTVGTSPECLPVDYQYLDRIDDDTLNYFVGWDNVDAHGVLNKIP